MIQRWSSIPILLLVLLFENIFCQQPTNCEIEFNSTNPPPTEYCNNETLMCNFTQGLTPLITSNTTEDSFVLCMFLEQYTLNFQSDVQENLKEMGSIYIQAKVLNLKSNYALISKLKIVLKGQQIELQNCQISGGLVWVESTGLLSLNNAKIENTSYIQSACSCLDQVGSNCSEQWKFKFPILFEHINGTHDNFNLSILYESESINFENLSVNSIILIGQQQVRILDNSSVESSVIGIFSLVVTVNQSTVTTTGNGYPSSTGKGCGYFDEILNQLLGCTGSGGSFGGYGGNSSPDNCNLMISRTPYSANQYPTEPGSGGGFFLSNVKEASSGGGVINIQGTKLYIWGSNITANGKSGTQGGGGGSGGSISMDYLSIQGDSTVQANGGGGKSSGGGGRMWIYNHNWRYQTYQKGLSQFKIKAEGGPDCLGKLSCGEDGSVSTSPCQPGYQLNTNTLICENCLPGYYQSQFGYSQCDQCANKPSNSYYIKANDTQLYKNACKFECSTFFLTFKIKITTQSTASATTAFILL